MFALLLLLTAQTSTPVPSAKPGNLAEALQSASAEATG